MKKSDLLFKIEEYFACDGVLSHSYPPHEVKFTDRHVEMMAKDILEIIEEAGLKPPTYINPIAYKKDPEIFDKGPSLAYCGYLDKYPSHYFEGKTRRPYEFYLEGWEEEDKE